MSKDIDNLGKMTEQEQADLDTLISAIKNKIIARHKGAEPEDLEAALYDLQDTLGDYSVNADGNDLE